MIDSLDFSLLRAAQNGIELTEKPYLLLGEELGISDEEVIKRLKLMTEQGIIRRFAATMGHRALGIVANAMVAWKVAPQDLERVGTILASSQEVTHCYERELAHNWPYNLYTVIHSRSKEDCLRIAKELSDATSVEEYKVLFSEKEYKKTSARI
ncbi:MAG: Lrp/AsnC family transcriptional regulator [Methanotrichaceae archaeon]|nr:Lrp/AsnC family transcriptional regulator [Methanotrichaceae archaeon]